MDVREKTSNVSYGFDIAYGLRNACNAGKCVADMTNSPCPFVKDVACDDVTIRDWLDVFRDALN